MRLTAITIGLDPKALERLRELAASKYRRELPDGSQSWHVTYGDLIRFAVREFLARHDTPSSATYVRTPGASSRSVRTAASSAEPKHVRKPSSRTKTVRKTRSRGAR